MFALKQVPMFRGESGLSDAVDGSGSAIKNDEPGRVDPARTSCRIWILGVGERRCFINDHQDHGNRDDIDTYAIQLTDIRRGTEHPTQGSLLRRNDRVRARN
jgi:hypothetical protein